MPDLRVIAISTHDMDAARDFYLTKLGFELQSDKWAPQYVELASNGPLLLLQQVEFPCRAADSYPDGAQVLLNLHVDDAYAEFDRLRDLGVRMLNEAPEDSPVGPGFAVADPSGNVIELVQFDG